MKWTKDNSIALTRVCVAVFAAALLLVDIFGYRLVVWYAHLRNMGGLHQCLSFMISLYTLSIFAWILLWNMWKLLSNMDKGDVFTAANIKHLRTVSWCCGLAAVICAASAVYYPPFLFAAAAAAFMMLIVRIVKNVFQTASEMKSELDLTI